MREQRKQAKVRAIRKNHREQNRMLVLCIATIFIVFVACSLFGNILSSAHDNRSDNRVNYKYYTSIEIQAGDTLWDIAEEYITEDYKTVQDYIKALKEMNSLHTDDIEAGQKLMVAYNDTEFIE